MRRTSLAVVALCALMMGCGDSKPPEYGKKAPVVYNRVVSLSPSATEISVGTFSRILLGRTAKCNSPGGVRNIAIVTDGTKPDLEKIKGLKPDCIVFDRDELDASSAKLLESVGIPIFQFGGDTITEFVDSVFAFGRLSGSEQLGSKYVDKVLLERDVALAERPKVPVRIAVLSQDSLGVRSIARSGGFVSDVLTTAGGKPIGPPGKGWATLDFAWLAAQNPQVIIVAGPIEGIGDSPLLAATSAGRGHKIFQVDPDLPTRRGWRVDRFIRLAVSLVRNVPEAQGK